jgi:hypothetical protein
MLHIAEDVAASSLQAEARSRPHERRPANTVASVARKTRRTSTFKSGTPVHHQQADAAELHAALPVIA